jgi:hypothetical protein
MDEKERKLTPNENELDNEEDEEEEESEIEQPEQMHHKGLSTLEESKDELIAKLEEGNK